MSQQGYPPGVRLYGVLFAVCLALIPLSLHVLRLTTARDDGLGAFVAVLGAILAIIGITAMAGTCLLYQARPSPRPPVGRSLVLVPPVVVRAQAVLTVIGLATAIVGTAVDAMSHVLAAIFPVIFLYPLSLGLTAVVARLEADAWGIRRTKFMTTMRIPWNDVRSLEARGDSLLSQRIVVVTKHGHERSLAVWDPRIPVTRDVAQILVAELEAVRQSAMNPHTNGIQ